MLTPQGDFEGDPPAPGVVRLDRHDRRLDQRNGPRVERRPDEIATHRFALRLFGFDSREVRRAQLEISDALDHARTELTRETLRRAALERALEKSLEEAKKTIRELQDQLRVAQSTLVRYQALERMLECELLVVEALKRVLPDGEDEGEPSPRHGGSSATKREIRTQAP